MAAIIAADDAVKVTINIASPPATAPAVIPAAISASSPLSELDHRYLTLCFQLKSSLSSGPVLTGFRVFAIIVYEKKAPYIAAISPGRDGYMVDEGYVMGTNTEVCHMGSSICAERTGLLQLRFISYESVRRIYLISDSPTELTPGLLCREFMIDMIPHSTPIIMASARTDAPGYSHRITSVAQLWPLPPLFLHIAARDVVARAQAFATTAKDLRSLSSDEVWYRLHATIVAESKHDDRDHLYPLRLAAGVLFNDGSTAVEYQSKLGEFGHTLDPIVKLIPGLQRSRKQGRLPVVIMCCDQFGNCHPPTAPARAHLSEDGFKCSLVIHRNDGTIGIATIQSLVPDGPDVDAGLAAARAS